MHPAALAKAIGAALPHDATVLFDGGHTSLWSNDFTPTHAPRTRFHEPGMSQPGFGLPWGIGLALAEPGRRVIDITGDGSFGFTLQELDTARRYGAPVVTVIHNNAVWGVVAAGQKNQNFSLGGDLGGTDYAAIALASGLPAVLDCRTRFVPHPMLPAFGRMGSIGIASS